MASDRQYDQGTRVVIDPSDSEWSAEGTVMHDEVINDERLYIVDVDGDDGPYRRFRPWDLQEIE